MNRNIVLSYIAAGAGSLLVWGFFFGYLFMSPNFAEYLIGGLSGVAVGVLLRPIVLQELEKRFP